MGRAARQVIQDQNNAAAISAKCLMTLATGVNPDQTAFTLPVTSSNPNSAAATVTGVATGTGSAVGVVAAANLRCVGFAVKETAGSTATAVIHHSADNTGPALGYISLAANGVLNVSWGDDGLACPNGIYVERLTGTTQFSIFTKVA